MQHNHHDRLFKWLIVCFTEEFFEHYFPDIKIGEYTFIDKEFVNRYEALKGSLEGDLFLIMEMEIDGELHEIIIQIEHKSQRKDAREQAFEYASLAWLLKRRPVWSIIFYTDDTYWRTALPEEYWIGYHSQRGKQTYSFDVIKLNNEKSSDLIKKHSVLCKLLALKADDRSIDREELVREILQFVASKQEMFDDEKLLMLHQFLDCYGQIPEDRYETIKREAEMTFVATHITEYYEHLGEQRGEKIGEQRGEKREEILARKSMYQSLKEDYLVGDLPEATWNKKRILLEKEIEELENQLSAFNEADGSKD